jgi:Zn-dependent protease
MNARIELGRIAGIPIYLDMWFVLVLMLLSSRYFTSGDTQLMSVGIVVVVGLLLSILMHELGHAFAGRMFKQRVEEIELGGFGGLCKFERSLPRSVWLRTVVYLAGPAVNIALWFAFGALAASSLVADKFLLKAALSIVAISNLYLAIFNCLPAYPLDGGQTLDAWLGPLLGPAWSVRVVAVLGLLVSIAVALYALPSQIFLLLVALSLFLVNWQALQSVGGIGGR